MYWPRHFRPKLLAPYALDRFLMVDARTELKSSAYPKENCQIGIVHVGFGAFHRAHQAFFVDAMMEKTSKLGWGIAAVNLRDEDSPAFAATKMMDNGYVLKTVSGEGIADHVRIRSHTAFEDWSLDPVSAAQIVSPKTVQMLTITVTESGYYFGDDGKIDLDHDSIKQEIEGGKSGTIYAYLRSALDMRRRVGGGAISILCCDNIRHNGNRLQQNFEAYLSACGDHELIEWTAQNTSFPCSMVDRITPQPTVKLRGEINETIGLDDPFCVMSEDFVQWVIEDNFAGVRPPLDRVGVQFVSDVTPYEEAKIRILNAGHSSIAYLAALEGYEMFDAAIADPKLFAHFHGFEQEEAIPALGGELPLDLAAYCETVTQRFKNSNIADTVQRISMDGMSKFSLFIVPTLKDCFAMGKVPERAIGSAASWYVLAQKVASGQSDFNLKDANWHMLLPYLAEGAAIDFAGSSEIWGDLPALYPQFSQLLLGEIKALSRQYAEESDEAPPLNHCGDEH